MQKIYWIYCLLSCCLIGSLSLQGQDSCRLEIVNMSCERLGHPIGIELETPRLSWNLITNCNGQKQKAYQILVASSKDKLQDNNGDIWNSQKVTSSNTLQIPVRGKKMKSAHAYYWKVKVWNTNNQLPEWSPVCSWTMGLIEATDKQAKWIGINSTLDSATKEQKEAAHYIYTTFQTNKEKQLIKATAFVSGLGLFDFYVNGSLISNHRLNPSNTNFFKRASYVGFDISKQIVKNKNALGFVLGNGKHLLRGKGHLRRYGLPRLWCQIHLEYSDGSSQVIKSDSTWKISIKGPIHFNNEFDGEHYDARKEIKAWASVEMQSGNWQKATLIKDYQPILSPQLQEPVRVIELRSAITISEPHPGVYIFDFGQNMTGWGRLKIKGNAGDHIKMHFAELLGANGQLDSASIRGARATDQYTLKGNGYEIFEPRFTYHGFRYVEVKGLKSKPDTSILKACVAHNDLLQTGSFSCSNDLLNKIYKNAVWSIRGNYQHVPVDCPQRDERFGWLGDRAATAFGELYIYDIHHIYAKWMQDIADEQLENGRLPNLAPAHWKVFRDNVTWPATYIQLVGMLYKTYGDSFLVQQQYQSMKKWMDFIAQNYIANNIVFCDQYSDWYLPPEAIFMDENKDARLQSSSDILATATYIKALEEMRIFALLLGKKKEAKQYADFTNKLEQTLYGELTDKTTATYGNHTPTELLLLLSANALSDENQANLLDNLVGKLDGEHNGHLAFGLVGMRWPMRVLSDGGQADLAFRLATQRTYPSLGYMIDNKATTIWETWNGDHSKSQNHVMLLGDLLHWLFAYLGGIRQAKEAIAFDKIHLQPVLPLGLDSVSVIYDSPRGRIESHWQKNDNTFCWSIKLPVGVQAEVYLPCAKAKTSNICLNGTALKNIKTKDNYFLRFDSLVGQGLFAVFRIPNGSYLFQSKLDKKKQKKQVSAAPKISVQDSVINYQKHKKCQVELSAKSPDTKIYYTTDGTAPSPKSTCYSSPLELTEYSFIKAIAQEKGKAPSYIKNSIVDFYDPQKNGWNYWYYEQGLNKLPDFDTLSVVDSGQISVINLDSIKKRKHFWACRFEAKIEIPKEGTYTFYLAADDGARLRIDGKEVVLNDGIHYKTQRSGKINLTKGKHRIEMQHFNSWSFNSLGLIFSGPGYPRQPVPLSILFFE